MTYDAKELQSAAAAMTVVSTIVMVAATLAGAVLGLAAGANATIQPQWLVMVVAFVALSLVGLTVGWLVTAPLRLFAQTALCLQRVEQQLVDAPAPISRP